MAQRSRLSTTLSGIAGEYLVAGELSRRGYVASLTLKNTRGIDILVSNVSATRSIGIQVKTRQEPGTVWVLSQKAEQVEEAAHLFYVFVSLNDLEPPSYHIVPYQEVAQYVRQRHHRWLNTPGRAGRPHGDSSMRKFADPDSKYLDRWDLLDLDAAG